MDTQLQQIVREAEIGKRFADKLAKVWQRSGKQTCVFVHIEIQSQRESNFAKRVFSYYYRLSDRFDEPIVSLAVLADADRRWRPSTHSKTLWGCSVSFTFPVVKLLDYRQQWTNLEASENPFATVVMAHLKTQETHNKPRQRQATKLALARALLNKGYERQTVINLLRLTTNPSTNRPSDLPSNRPADTPADLSAPAIVNYPLLVQVLQACWGEIDEETQQRLGQLDAWERCHFTLHTFSPRSTG